MGRFTEADLKGRILTTTQRRAPPSGKGPPTTEAPPKARKKPDTSGANSLTTAIRELLTLLGCEIWRHNNAGVYDTQKKVFRAGSSRRGLPDTLGFYRATGHIVAVEVKYGQDVLSDVQRNFLALVRAAGGFACEGRDVEQVRREFNQWKSTLPPTP
jgi:hypothetical protein